MNEAETRAELIDPKLKACGWGVVEGSKILREYQISKGKIQSGGIRSKRSAADYVLVYKGLKLAIIEAKSNELEVGEGVMQAKLYAEKLQLETTYSSNGKEIYQICLKTGEEQLVTNFLSPSALWEKTFAVQNQWRENFATIPFEDKSGTWELRFYQEIAINKTLEAIANNKQRILLTLATGTGKTAIAFQVAWKLFQTRWNLNRDGSRRPRILFLADRNILADQAFNSFSAFPEDALVRIKPNEIKKKGKVPTNGSIFFTIFQSFMSGKDKEGNPIPNYGQYAPDYFDFIIIDECHRGGANDEGNWRGILEYFSPAVQLGLTATPKRKDNVDTYAYFGEPVYVYSLKEGINDGFLTPFKVKRIQSTLDEYVYTSDDEIIEGVAEEGKVYKEDDFNRKIEIMEREADRVKMYMNIANQNEKAIVFCATQVHAAAVRDLINQLKTSDNINYCVRVTANDGAIGEQFLREFQDNEKTIPTILTTSQKLSTGVDARNIRNIVLMRSVNSMIEFKQIVGRGTRLFEGKDFFTIYDYVNAYHHFADPEWDGEPIAEEPCEVCNQNPCVCTKAEKKPCKICGQRPCICEKPEPKNCKDCGKKPCVCKKKVKIKLRNGKVLEIQHMVSTMFWQGSKPITVEEFLNNLFGELPKFFKSEAELRELWSNPLTRRTLLEKLAEAGFGNDELTTLQKLIDAEKSDLFDVLEFVFNSNIKPITREARVAAAQATIFTLLNDKQKEFIEFVLAKYVETGVGELDQEKLPVLLTNKYQSFEDAKAVLGEVADIKTLFIDFQKYLYQQVVA
ncbi:MAG: restriction endonuclease subunit R [Bacteroidetes bacterium HGW-Bacteroidetes-3]|jgi:type I restriction enzyme R subunit|nr:MAG: restriction endonuclease subunit R [Bacteroidetes bacterium HGW-Bacteroidetes-3]